MVLDGGAFERFKETGLFDQDLARSYRKNILEAGASEPPMDLYKRFRGAEPKIDALLTSHDEAWFNDPSRTPKDLMQILAKVYLLSATKKPFQLQTGTMLSPTMADIRLSEPYPGWQDMKSADRVDEMRARIRAEKQRLRLLEATVAGKIELQQEQVARLEEILQFHRDRVESMTVQAGASGILQESDLEVGQWVQPGRTLAKVSCPPRR